MVPRSGLAQRCGQARSQEGAVRARRLLCAAQRTRWAEVRERCGAGPSGPAGDMSLESWYFGPEREGRAVTCRSAASSSRQPAVLRDSASPARRGVTQQYVARPRTRQGARSGLPGLSAFESCVLRPCCSSWDLPRLVAHPLAGYGCGIMRQHMPRSSTSVHTVLVCVLILVIVDSCPAPTGRSARAPEPERCRRSSATRARVRGGSARSRGPMVRSGLPVGTSSPPSSERPADRAHRTSRRARCGCRIRFVGSGARYSRGPVHVLGPPRGSSARARGRAVSAGPTGPRLHRGARGSARGCETA